MLGVCLHCGLGKFHIGIISYPTMSPNLMVRSFKKASIDVVMMHLFVVDLAGLSKEVPIACNRGLCRQPFPFVTFVLESQTNFQITGEQCKEVGVKEKCISAGRHAKGRYLKLINTNVEYANRKASL